MSADRLSPQGFEDAVAAAYWHRNRDDMAPTIAAFADLAVAHPNHGPASFELANALDAGGEEARAERHYRHALDLGLAGDRYRRCVVQLASTLTALGRPDEALAVLADARADHPQWPEVGVFAAIALHRAGRTDQAFSELLRTFAEHHGRDDLNRYRAAWTETADTLGHRTGGDQA